MIKNLSVPDPCGQDWDQMPLKAEGRHCSSCQKTVIDFTVMSDQQILDYLSGNRGKKMCGTFKNSQLNSAPAPLKPSSQLIRFVAAALIVFGITLFSCQSVDLGDKPPAEPAFLQESCQTTGIIIAPESLQDTNESSSEPAEEIKEITITGITTGEISLPDTFVPPEIIPDTPTTPTSIITGVVFADVMPEFRGNISEYILKNLHYPQEAIDKGIEGTVYVNFLVRTDGTIDNIKILKGIGSGCDEEAIRVVSEMPPWKPGSDNGKNVDVQFNLPLKFRFR
jgi:TonB family protein